MDPAAVYEDFIFLVLLNRAKTVYHNVSKHPAFILHAYIILLVQSSQ